MEAQSQTSPPAPDKWPSEEDIQFQCDKRFPIKDQRKDVFSSDNKQFQKQLAFKAAVNWIKNKIG